MANNEVSEKARNVALKDCPFCGVQPEIEQCEVFRDVTCRNAGCLVQPKALGILERPATVTWNTRYDSHTQLISNLVEALKEIADPVSAMRARLQPDEQLSGSYAVMLSNDPNYLKGIARATLTEAHKKMDEGKR